jgi:DNA-binding NarL/FixJ family response regulator
MADNINPPYSYCQQTMSHSSQHTKEAGVLVVDQQHRLRNALCTELRIDCSVTAYEARTSGEAVALTQAVQPDVVLLDPGRWDASSAQLLQQILKENAHLGLLVYPDVEEIEAVVGTLKEWAVGSVMSPAIKHFSFALCRACRERLLTEPDMVHQLFRTWHQDSLEPGLPTTSKHRQLKVLVLALRNISWGNGTWLDGSEELAWQGMISRWAKPWQESCSVVCNARKADLRQVVHSAGGWLSRSCKTAWQLGHAFLTSPSVDASSLSSTKTASPAQPLHRLLM